MKKILLPLLLCTTLPIFAETHQKLLMPNALEKVADEYRTHFFDLPLWAQTKIVGLSTLAGACTWLTTRAFTNVFQAKERTYDAFDVTTWTWAECITTPLGLAYFSKMLLENETPEGIARTANKNGLLKTLLTCSSNKEIEEALDHMFITEQFPRAVAFGQLTALRIALKRILDLVSTLQKYRYNKRYDVVVKNLSSNLTVVESALLHLKSDPKWLAECNAQTLKQFQNVDEARFNAQLANAAIDFAHAYARSK